MQGQSDPATAGSLNANSKEEPESQSSGMHSYVPGTTNNPCTP